MTIKTDDRSAIVDLLARYCWLIDEGDADGWAALWTKDGKFTGIPQPLEGTEQLKQMPPGFFAMANGKLRHVITNIVVDEGKNADEASAKGYSSLYDVSAGTGKLVAFAKANYSVVRINGQWRIKALHADMVLSPG